MAETNFRGPVQSMGALEQQQATTGASVEPMDGPMGSYQGDTMLDPRGFPFAKDGTAPGRSPAYVSSPVGWTVDNYPQASATNVIASAIASNLTASLPIALQTVGAAGATAGNPSVAVAIPIIPLGTTTVTTAALALDFGFTTGTTTANSSTVNCADNSQLSIGQWIIIGNVGNSANTASLFTQVTSIATTNLTGITVNPAPAATLGNAPIGQANLMGATLLPSATQFGPGSVTPTAHTPRSQAGMLRVWNPREAISRAVSVSLVTGGTATAIPFLVSGWDVHGQAMTELITSPATTSATLTFGVKAFKYIASVVQNTPTSGNTYSVGLTDTFGLPLRADDFSQAEVYFNGNAIATSNGFTQATTVLATNTTGDVRGTWQLSTVGKLGTSALTVKSTGTARLSIIQNLGVWNTINATPNNLSPLYGTTNSTT